MKLVVGMVLCAALVIGAVTLEVSVWRECRADHSWLYCVRMMSK